MKYNSKHVPVSDLKTSCLIVGVHERHRTGTAFDTLDQTSGGLLSRVLRKGDFHGRTGETLMLYQFEGVAAARILPVSYTHLTLPTILDV